jgi:VCBS repeat-containing protein
MKKRKISARRLLSVLVVLTILIPTAMFSVPVPVAQAVDTDWLDPSGDAGYGSQNFSSPTDAYHDDTLYAEGIALRNDPVGQEYYGYDVTDIPAGSAIQGIEVETHYWLDGIGGTNTMEVALSSDSTNWTTAQTDTSEPTSETPVTFGSGSDLWGRAWSVTDISNLRVRVRGITTVGTRIFRLDWVGVRITYNSPPTISDIGDQNTDEDTTIGPIQFTVGDADTPAASLIVSGESSDTTLVPNANIIFGFGVSGADRTITLTPAGDLSGSAVITVTIDDGALTASDSFILTVNPVNDAPVADDNAYTVDEGSTLTVAAPGVLDNDTDVEAGDILTATLVSDVSNGTLTLNANGSLTYVHDGSETTSDTFTYQAYDGNDLSNVATVTITVNPANDAPVANDDAYSVEEGGTLIVAAPGVLDNDTDVDAGDILTATLVSDVSNGTLTLNTDGSFTYVHDGSETISDTFTYQAYDGIDLSNVATVNIDVGVVNDAPVADDDTYSVDEGSTLTVAAPGVLDNDTDLDVGDILTATLVSDVSNGTLTLNADGSLTYVHDGSETTSDSFTYQAYDGSDLSNVATVNITVNPVNDAPVANDNAYSVNEGEALTIAAPGVLDNDTDVDAGDILTATLVGDVSNGTLTLNTDGSFTYVHDDSETTSDSFTYQAYDGSDLSNVATVTMTVNPANDAPVADDDAYSVNEGGTLTIVAPGVLDNDTDVESDALTATLVSDVSSGTLTLNANGSFTYVHDGSETTSDTFTYQAYDSTDLSNIATVTITIENLIYLPIILRNY